MFLRKLFAAKTKLATGLIALLTLTSQSLAMESSAKQAIVYDNESKTILFEKNANEQMTPSSMTKLMTTYIVFSHLKKGILKLDDTFNVSEKAWRKGGSKTFVKLNSKVTIEDLIKGIVVQSGNDACIVVAEGISSSEEAFAELMNKTAKEIGLTGSHFKNATGWPDEGHYMSARDLAVLSARLIEDFPEYYHYFAQKEFTYNGIKQYNRNLLLNRDGNVDGLKTGHTDDGGYGITISAKDETGRRIIVVVNGLNSEKERANEAERLINHGFRYFENVKLFTASKTIESIPVWYGKENSVDLVSNQKILTSIPKANRDSLKVKVKYSSPITAPISTSQPIATLLIEGKDIGTKEYPLYAKEEVSKTGLFGKLKYNLNYLLSDQL